MSENKSPHKDEKIYPSAVTGIAILNDRKEIFLIRNKKFGDSWIVPGGHVELGETMEECILREIKEETNFEVKDLKYIGIQEAIFPKEFHKKKHFIFLDFTAHYVSGEIVKNDEIDEYVWVDPKKALAEYKMSVFTKRLVEKSITSEESEDYKDMYLRALADYQNIVKQSAKERSEFVKYANEQLLLDIIPAFDNFKIAIEHADGSPENLKAVVEGVKYVVKQFEDVFSSYGLEKIKTVGEKFDHNTMEAMEGEGDMVTKEIRSGYKLKDKVIVAAKVSVGDKK